MGMRCTVTVGAIARDYDIIYMIMMIYKQTSWKS